MGAWVHIHKIDAETYFLNNSYKTRSNPFRTEVKCIEENSLFLIVEAFNIKELTLTPISCEDS